jgi:hypothetical protein
VYNIVYTPARKSTVLSGFSDLIVSLAVFSGLLATYYSSSFAAPIGVGTAAMTGGTPHSSVTGAYSARYRGFFRPSTAGSHVFAVTLPAQITQFVMYLDGITVASASGNSDSIVLPVANGLYDVEITVQSSASSASASLAYGGSALGSRFLQRHDIVHKIWDSKGLYATFYASSTVGSSPLYSTSEQNLDWSYSLLSPRYSNFVPDSFTSNSIRWNGFFLPTLRGLYTFYVLNSAGSGTIALDFQAPVSFTTSEVQATVFVSVACRFYDITVEVTTTTSATSSIQLQWSNNGQSFSSLGAVADASLPKQVVPVESLFGIRTTSVINRNDQHHYYDSGSLPSCGGTSAGSSSSFLGALRWFQCRGAGIRNNGPLGGTAATGGSAAALKLLIYPAHSCGTTSSITTSLSRTTAGLSTSFNVRINDAYGNILDSTHNAIYISAVPQSGVGVAAIGTVIPTATGVTQSDPAGRYTATYTLTQSGSYWVSAAVVDHASGGLTATVINDLNHVIHSRKDPSVSCCSDWDLPWGTGKLRVQWSGFIRMNDARSSSYTFHIRAASGGTKFFIASRLLAHCPSIETPCSVAAVTQLSLNAVYDVVLEHNASSSKPYVAISYSSSTGTGMSFVPSQLYAYSANVGNGMLEVICDPDAYNSGLHSTLYPPPSLATAGAPATFVIASYDKYGNMRIQSGASPDCASSSSTATACAFRSYIVPEKPSANNRPIRGITTVQSVNAFFNVAYTVTAAGLYTLSVASYVNWVPYGLSSTYYDGHDFTSPASSTYPQASVPAWSLVGAAVPSGSGLVPDGLFSARFAGAFFTSTNGLYTAYMTHMERLRVFIDSVMVIDQFSYSGVSQISSGTILLNENTFYEYVVELVSDADADSIFAFEIRNPSAAALSLTASNVFYRSVRIGSALSIEVLPGIPCGARSFMSGATLSLATSGVSASFSITSRDAYSNVRLTGTDTLVARAIPILSTGGYIRTFFIASLPFQHNQFNGYSSFTGSPSCASCTPLSISVADIQNGVYVASLVPQKTGWFKMIASFARPGGLTATFVHMNLFGFSLDVLTVGFRYYNRDTTSSTVFSFTSNIQGIQNQV